MYLVKAVARWHGSLISSSHVLTILVIEPVTHTNSARNGQLPWPDGASSITRSVDRLEDEVQMAMSFAATACCGQIALGQRQERGLIFEVCFDWSYWTVRSN